MDLITLGALMFFTAAFIAISMAQNVALERRQINKSLRTIKTMDLQAGDVRKRELATPFRQRVAKPAVVRLGALAKRMSPASVPEKIARELRYAGSPAKWDVERVLAMKILGMGAMTLWALLLALAGEATVGRKIMIIVLFAAIGFYLPDWVLRSRSSKRQSQIQRVLPDSLDLLSITVEAGLGFDAALARVSKETGGPFGEEIHRVGQEMQLGVSRSDAMRDLGERTTVDELRSFVLAMIQADVFGVSIAKVLHIQAGEMRLKRRQRAEERAQKIPVKIIFPVLFCIFPALFIVLLGPAAISIYQSLFNR